MPTIGLLHNPARTLLRLASCVKKKGHSQAAVPMAIAKMSTKARSFAMVQPSSAIVVNKRRRKYTSRGQKLLNDALVHS